MLDISTIKRRYFDIRIGDVILNIEPPQKKIYNKIVELTKSKDVETVADNLYLVAELILNKNKTGYVVPKEEVEKLDTDQINEIITQYFKWLSESKQLPN